MNKSEVVTGRSETEAPIDSEVNTAGPLYEILLKHPNKQGHKLFIIY